MPIAEKLRSLEDNLVRERNNEKALYNLYEHVQTSRDVKRKQVEGEFYSTILQDLELFLEQPEQEMSFPAQFSATWGWR